jgi:hypothetical protein
MRKFASGISNSGICLAVIAMQLAFVAGCKGKGEEEKGRPAQPPARILAQEGQIVVKMDVAKQAQNGITVALLRFTSEQQDLRAPATVLSAQALNDLRNSYVTARMRLEKAQASLQVSGPAYQRLNALYQEQQNASLSAMQAAEGTLRSDEASVKAAQDGLSLLESGARQQWGSVIANWLLTNPPALQRLIQQRDLLIQVTPGPGLKTPAPDAVRVQADDAKISRALFVSSLPRLDPRIQAPSYLYATPANYDLVPGMNLIVLLPQGARVRGALIPASAVVWWQGRAWAYVQTTADTFVQREVATDAPMENGWFAAKGFSPGEKLVIKGAQQLLSEEFSSQIQASGGDTD